MRLLIYARAQEAVPLFMALKMDRTDPVSLLMGGMPPEIIDDQIRKFEDHPGAIMVATAAFQQGWRANVEAMVLFAENSFVQSKAQAANRVREPRFPIPTPEMLLELMSEEHWLTSVQGEPALIEYEANDDNA